MTTLREAAQQALEALERGETKLRWAAIAALKAALAEQDGTCKYCTNGCPACDARKQRKPLTEEEIERVCVPLGAAMLSFTEVARAIERAHGIDGPST